MARIRKNPYTITEIHSANLGCVYGVFSNKGEKLKTFISLENAEKYSTQLFLEIQAKAAIRAPKPNGITKDLKAEFGDTILYNLNLI
jgi:hypothetical protein